MIDWPHDIAYFFGGAFFFNALPHLIMGLMGKPFQSPFAKPPGQGLSTSTTNALWGLLNLAVAYGLILRIGAFDPRANDNIGAFALGAFLMSVMLARHFGRFNRGNARGDPPA